MQPATQTLLPENTRPQQKNCKCDRKAQRISTLEHRHTFSHQISSAKQIQETARKFATLEWLRTLVILRSENIDSQEKQERSRKQRKFRKWLQEQRWCQKKKRVLGKNRWWEEHNTIPQKTRHRKAINPEKKRPQIFFYKKSDYRREKKTTVFRTETGDVKKENGKCWIADNKERDYGKARRSMSAHTHTRDGERKKEMRTKGLERIWVLCPTVRRSPSCYRYLLVSRNCGLSGGPWLANSTWKNHAGERGMGDAPPEFFIF
jgi:hypothetical protein